MYKLTYILRGLEEPKFSTTTQGGVYNEPWEVNSLGDGTYGREVGYKMKMYKCFWPNCIKPTTTTTTGTTTTEEPLVECDFGDDGCELFETEENLLGQNETTMYVRDKRVVNMKKVPNGKLSITKMAVDGELNILPEEDITIEVSSLLMNTGLSFNKRNKRDIYDVFTGKIRIGTEENPVPCNVKVHIKLMGNVSTAEEFGVLGIFFIPFLTPMLSV